MGKRNKQRNSRRFVMLYNDMIASKKWKGLSFSAKALYVRLKHKFRGHNNGQIYLPYSELNDEFSKGTIARAFKELQNIGAIQITQKGGLYRKYALYMLVEDWWQDKIQPSFLKHFALKNDAIHGRQLPPHVQNLVLSQRGEQTTSQDQKIGPYLESTITI